MMTLQQSQQSASYTQALDKYANIDINKTNYINMNYPMRVNLFLRL